MSQAEWMLTDEETEKVPEQVRQGQFIWQGLTCPDMEKAQQIAQARKLVELVDHNGHYYTKPDGTLWFGVLRSWWQQLCKDVNVE